MKPIKGITAIVCLLTLSFAATVSAEAKRVFTKQ